MRMQRGLAPRVFEYLFEKLEQQQDDKVRAQWCHACHNCGHELHGCPMHVCSAPPAQQPGAPECHLQGKAFTYTCKVSMLEIYNEVITDLLESKNTNLQARH